MHHRSIAACLAAACLAAPAGAHATVPPEQLSASITAGTSWIKTKQNVTTGAFTGFGGDWSLIAFSAAGIHPATLGTPSAQDYFLGVWSNAGWAAPTDYATLKNASGYVATDFERAILMADAGGLQPTRLSAQSNLVAQLAGLYQPNGAYGAPGLFNGTVFGVLAMARTKVPASVLRRGTDVIRANVHNDGGWTYTLTTTAAQKAANSDIDMTGAALAALCNAGVPSSDAVVAGGLAFLKGKLDSTTGAFNAQFGKNADSNAWAVQGLNACGVDPQSAEWTTAAGKTPLDYLVALQRTTGANAGSFKYSTTESDGANPNLYATQDAITALAGASFSADPPAVPGVRPAPAVAAGTTVPVVLALDDGHGGVNLCRTTAPAGAPLGEVLAAAKAASMPPNCVTELTLDSGTVTSVNGQRADSARGGWLASLDGAAETLAATQPVPFGDIVALRLQHSALPAGSVETAPVAFPGTAAGTIGGARSVTFTAREYPVHPTRAAVSGDDFLVSGDDCTGATLQPGTSCTVRVRFAPSESGERTGALQLLSDAATASAALTGTGTTVQAAAGAKGDAGAPGPKGDTGAAGAKGGTGARGRDAKVTCKLVGKARRKVTCTVKGAARLTRAGRVYARGGAGTLRAAKRLERGRYTLRAGSRKMAVTLR
jgi:hypothetical protein